MTDNPLGVAIPGHPATWPVCSARGQICIPWRCQAAQSQGSPPATAAPAFAGVFAPGSDDWVWPHPNGTVRGQVEPLHPCTVFAAIQMPNSMKFWPCLMPYVVAVRVSRGFSAGLAPLIYPDGPKPAEGPCG